MGGGGGRRGKGGGPCRMEQSAPPGPELTTDRVCERGNKITVTSASLKAAAAVRSRSRGVQATKQERGCKYLREQLKQTNKKTSLL